MGNVKEVGERLTTGVTVEFGVTVTVAVPYFVGSATLVALTVTVVLAETVGAVNNPELDMLPAVADQVTEVLVEPVTVAVNGCVPPDATVAEVGAIATCTAGVLLPKNSPICGAVAAAPGKLVKPRASIIIRTVL